MTHWLLLWVTLYHLPISSKVGVCILRYAYGFSVMSKKSLCRDSCDKDGHASAMSEDKLCAVTSDGLKRLCRECIHLVCIVMDTYHSVRKHPSQQQDR